MRQKTEERWREIFLSTPSGWRATIYAARLSIARMISIHALRVEGDADISVSASRISHFYPRPPGGGRLAQVVVVEAPRVISIHALRVEGDRITRSSRPESGISIHALRVEGDDVRKAVEKNTKDFYPRPPGGGRRQHGRQPDAGRNFYPRPPGGGRPKIEATSSQPGAFLSTPSGWRATLKTPCNQLSSPISIHALRVEGDKTNPNGENQNDISIHALRVEGDRIRGAPLAPAGNFYPRPPGGGRLPGQVSAAQAAAISIHALRVEGDKAALAGEIEGLISIHALRVEGDRARTVIRSRQPISIHALRVEGDSRRSLWTTCWIISIHALRVEGDPDG